MFFKDLKMKITSRISEEDMIKSLASFLNGINILHPFREGNGRTQRLFIKNWQKMLDMN